MKYQCDCGREYDSAQDAAACGDTYSIVTPIKTTYHFENSYTIPPTPTVSQEDLILQLKQSIDRMNEMAQQYAAENERLRLHLDIAVEALEKISIFAPSPEQDFVLWSLAKIRKEK